MFLLGFLATKSNLRDTNHGFVKSSARMDLFWASSSFPDTVGTVGRKYVSANKSGEKKEFNKTASW